MLLHAASRVRGDRCIAEQVADLAAALARRARSETLLLRAALHPSLAEGMAVPHVLLTRLGHPDPAHERVFRASVSSPGSARRELPPYGMLEKLWLRELWCFPVAPATWRAVMRASVLAESTDLLGGLREDRYAFTHALMYCTDFGAVSRRMPRSRTASLRDAENLLAVTIDAADYDLAGEILMAWPFLGARWSDAASFSFGLLARVEDQAGLLPGGTTDIGRLRGLSGDQRREYALATAYHTAYVMGMLCAVSLSTDRLPEADLVATRAATDPDPDATVGAVEVAVRDELERASVRGLEGFRLDLAIAAAVRKNAFGRLATILSEADRALGPASPLREQATGLLYRLGLATQRQDSVA
jgi:Domain of unknown function (DUF6895)